MLDNHKFLAIAIIVSITGVLALYFYAASISPEEMAIADIGEDDIGSLVRLNGTIRNVKMMQDGSVSCELIDLDSNANIVVYIEPKAYEGLIYDEPGGGPTPGDEFQFIGTIEVYQDVFELVVSSGSDIRMLEDASESMISIHQLLQTPTLFDGMEVRTSGAVEDPYIISDANGTKGMGFELEEVHENHTYRLACVVFDNDMIGAYETGSMVEVSGTFQYYAGTGNWQVMMDDENDIFILP